MADKKYQIDFEMSDGSIQSVEFTSPQGEPGKTPVKGVDYFTDADKQEIAEIAADMVDVPEGGSNQPLTFTGAVNATYDGSQAVSVEIPVGGGSSGGLMGVEHTLLNTTVEIPADSPVTSITLDVPEVAKTCKAFQIFVYLSKPTNEHTATRTQVSICRHNLIYWNIGNTSATGGIGYWIIADCIKGIAYKKVSPNSFSANSNPFNCESASGLKKFPPSNSNNKFVFEMFSPYAGTVNIEVYGYN